MEERYLSVCVLSDPREADIACYSLEESGIPVIIQHLLVDPSSSPDLNALDLNSVDPWTFDFASNSTNAHRTKPLRATGFRLLVPMRSAQTALKILKQRSASRPSAAPLQAA